MSYDIFLAMNCDIGAWRYALPYGAVQNSLFDFLLCSQAFSCIHGSMFCHLFELRASWYSTEHSERLSVPTLHQPFASFELLARAARP